MLDHRLWSSASLKQTIESRQRVVSAMFLKLTNPRLNGRGPSVWDAGSFCRRKLRHYALPALNDFDFVLRVH